MSDPVTQTAQTDDWRVEMLRTAAQVGEALSVKDRARNPLVPNNFLDVSDAGFPSDIIVKPVAIPAVGNVLQLQQYQEFRNKMWQHVKWSWISSNGGLDGKASIPGAEARDLGGGELVATLSGYYLMYADKKAYLRRRAENVEAANRRLEERVVGMEEKHERNARTFGSISEAQQLSVDELLEYEAKLPPPRQGASTSS